ncbi:hypothetical protein LTR50_002471 [Elasticomyces elasticus]|nr:hypothetical protein LTR50_002471 [Elasticomyces elasticus]
MEGRRGSALNETSYYDQAVYAEPQNNRQSFSARAARYATALPSYVPDPHTSVITSHNYVPPPDGASRTESRRFRESTQAPICTAPASKPAVASAQALDPGGYPSYRESYSAPTSQPSKGMRASNSVSSRAPAQPTVTIPPTKSYEPGYFGLSSTSPPVGSTGGEVGRGAVPDRSPLQTLEGKLDDISRVEKRARVEEAEHLAGQRTVTSRSQGIEAPSSAHATRPRRASDTSNTRVTNDVDRTINGKLDVSAPNSSLLNARHPEKGTIDFGGLPYELPVQTAANERPQTQRYYSATQRFRRASEALRMQQHYDANAEHATQSPTTNTLDTLTRSESTRSSTERPGSAHYRHRSRDAGFIGAAMAAGFGLDGAEGAERRSSKSEPSEMSSPSTGRSNSFLGRSNSRKLQKRNTHKDYKSDRRDPERLQDSQRRLQSSRDGTDARTSAVFQHNEQDPTPREALETPKAEAAQSSIPSQDTATQHAREQVGFANVQSTQPSVSTAQNDDHHHYAKNLFHHHHERSRHYEASKPLDEWRRAATARLTNSDLEIDTAQSSSEDGDSLWWGKSGGSRRTGSSRKVEPASMDGAYEEEAKSFRPPLYLKCGPLLRYTGLRFDAPSRTQRNGDREIWRGSVMIVTTDSRSSYEPVPTLRLFAQPMSLLPTKPANLDVERDGSPDTELIDPLAGQVKLSRTGQSLYVRPADHLQPEADLSRVENEDGLFEMHRSYVSRQGETFEPQDRNQRQHATQGESRIRRRDGEKLGKYREVKAARLHAERGVTFWRFNLEIELGSKQARVAYRINYGPAIGFWVPARGQTMNAMFHSCNGFSLSVNSNLFSGPDPLWRDVLNSHQSRPFHVMIGGGDQIYNDAAMRDTTLFRKWLGMKNPEHKHKADFSCEMQEELEHFYLDRYAMWFSQGFFGMANSQIPMVNIWDDHDIIDHQSVISETEKDEPSWILGASPGPYINELSRSVFLHLGRKVVLLGLDCRTERMRDEVMSQESYDIVFDRCRREILKGETKHLIVLLGVPIAYPRLNFLENVLTSRVMDPIKAIGRTGILGGFVNRFDGGVEILDDLDDHWTAKHHKAERNWFVQELQELASEKSVRITILGGDVHLGAVGQFYTNKKLGVPKDQDHRYMPNIVSSAIVNTPPPPMMGDILNKRNKIHHLDDETDEDMIPMFEHDVDGKPRNNHHLLPRRNYCTIREYHPGSTPPPTPPPQPQTSTSAFPQGQDRGRDERRYPPGSMKRTISLTRDSFRPGNLVRRLSGSFRSRNPPVSLENAHPYSPQNRRDSSDDMSRHSESGNRSPHEEGSYFPASTPTSQGTAPTRPGIFQRRTTSFSRKDALRAAAKGGADATLDSRAPGHIDLQDGLDIALHVEVNQKNPAGATVPYRLLVPALWYEGGGDINDARFKTRRAVLFDKLRGRGKKEHVVQEYESRSNSSRSSSADGRFQSDAIPTRTVPVGEVQTAQGRAHGISGAQDGAWDKEYGPPPPVSRHPVNAPARDGVPATLTRNYSLPNRAVATATAAVAPPAINSLVYPSTQPAQMSRQNTSQANDPYPSVNKYSRMSIQAASASRTAEYGRDRYTGYNDSDSDSLTPSDEYSEAEVAQKQQAPPQRPRRASKAERFFGIGDETVWGGTGRVSGKNSVDDGGRGVQSEGKKKGWKVWK